MSDLGNKEIFSKNLRYYINLSEKDRGDIADELGFSYSTFTDWINGNTYPRIDRIERLANYFGINKSDLIEGKVVPNKGSFNSIPLVGQVAAGTPILAEENIEDYINLDSRIKADFALRIKGDSMINVHIYDGDIAFIRKQSDLENGEIGVVLIDNEATLKRFYRDNGTIILQAENDSIRPKIFTAGDICVQGKLVAVLNIRE